MNVLFTRISTISVIVFVCVCNALDVRADKSTEWFLLDARLSKLTMRSAAPQQAVTPIRIDAMSGELSLVFYQQLEEVTIKVYDELMRPVYMGYSSNPQFEYIPTSGWQSGVYTVQIIAGMKSYVEYVFVE